MTFTGRLNAGMTKCKTVLKNGADNCKLEGMIAEHNKIIKNMKKEIAALTIAKLDEGEEMSPEIMERYAVICESRETIEALEKDRKTTKIVCPECGAKSSAKMNYCGNCGTKLQKEDVDDAAENDIEEVHEEETIEEGNVNEEE